MEVLMKKHMLVLMVIVLSVHTVHANSQKNLYTSKQNSSHGLVTSRSFLDGGSDITRGKSYAFNDVTQISTRNLKMRKETIERIISRNIQKINEMTSKVSDLSNQKKIAGGSYETVQNINYEMRILKQAIPRLTQKNADFTQEHTDITRELVNRENENYVPVKPTSNNNQASSEDINDQAVNNQDEEFYTEEEVPEEIL